MSLNEDSNEVCYMLDLDDPPEYVMEYAVKELGETSDTRACAVHELREMIYERGDIIPDRMDEAFLIRFLRARYYNVEKAHQLMVNYINFIEDNPGIQKGVAYLGDELQYISNENVISVLPYRDQMGRRVMIYRMGNWNPNVSTVEDVFKASLILLEMAIMEQRAQILGGICFFDMENLSLQQAWYITPSVANKIIQLMGGSFPIRIKAIHILNQPWVFDMVFAMFRPLLDERMRSKIHFHGTNFETLHEFIDPKHLPERYGGTREGYVNKDWIENLDTNPKIVEGLKNLGYVCELRVVKKDEEKDSADDKKDTDLTKDLEESREADEICQD